MQIPVVMSFDKNGNVVFIQMKEVPNSEILKKVKRLENEKNKGD